MNWLIHAPVPTQTASIQNGNTNAVLPQPEINIEEVISSLRTGAIDKVFRLRDGLIQTCTEILEKTQPIELGFKKQYIDISFLENANRTQIKYGQLKACRSDVRKALSRMDAMLETLNKEANPNLLPKQRIEKINKILENEEENNADGLLNTLDATYSHVRGIRSIIDSVINASIRNTDELPEMTSTERDGIFKQESDYVMWIQKAIIVQKAIDEAGEIREELKKLKSLIEEKKHTIIYYY